MLFKIQKNHGFTLLEILLVVGIISLLAGIVIVAINPGKQLASVRNTQRKSDLKQINSAINQYYITEGRYPSSLDSITFLTEICDTGNLPSPSGASCDSLVDLSVLVPTYITSIPKDPQGPITAFLDKFSTPLYAASGGTGYYVMKDSNQKLILNSERAELGVVIAIGTTTAMGGGEEEEEESWSCGDSLIDIRDDKTYATVLIDTQCWMQENLNIGTMILGANNQTDNGILEKYCYDDSEANCITYGGLYQWDEAMQYVTTLGAQGLCPTGWHIPTHDEFTTLERAVCTSDTCETDFPYDISTIDGRGTNEGTTMKNTSGVWKGFLGGYRLNTALFSGVGINGGFWSSLQSGSDSWRRRLRSGYTTVYRNPILKIYGLSLRCVRN